MITLIIFYPTSESESVSQTHLFWTDMGCDIQGTRIKRECASEDGSCCFLCLLLHHLGLIWLTQEFRKTYAFSRAITVCSQHCACHAVSTRLPQPHWVLAI